MKSFFERRRIHGKSRNGVISHILLGIAALTLRVNAQSQSVHDITLRLLEQRRNQQVAAASNTTAFHKFQFVDKTSASGIRFQHHIVDDAGKTYKAAHYDHGNGIAAADVDGDDWVDLYFVSQLGKNELWRNLGDGRFEDITSRAGVGMTNQISVGASFADVDNDGDADLFVTTVRHGNRLFLNLGEGRFRDVTDESGLAYSGHSSGALFFDYDRDGLLDLFVANVGVYTSPARGAGGYYLSLPDAFQGHLFRERNEFSILYHNEGAHRFKDVSKAMNIQQAGWHGDADFADLNLDGFPDLYVINMQGDDHFFENDRGNHFLERTTNYFPKTPWGSLGIKFFDANQDGKLDLLVTDMHSDMTRPQTELAVNFNREVEKSKSESFCAVQWTDQYLQGASNNIFGNALYLAQPDSTFVEASDKMGVETYWPWGASAGDVNADGYDDLFITAGMGYPFRYAVNSLLLNEGGRRFIDAEFLVGIEPRSEGRTEKEWFTLDCDGADHTEPACAGKSGKVKVAGALSSRSSVFVDLDNDGDLDIVTNELNDRPQVLISTLSRRREVHFLKVRLVGNPSNRDGLGAKVVVVSGRTRISQYHDGKSGYLGQSSLPLYFGLGSQSRVDRVEILWPSGTQQAVSNAIPVNGMLRVEESPGK